MSSLCEHGRLRTNCTQCVSSLCEHFRIRTKCKQCNPPSPEQERSLLRNRLKGLQRRGVLRKQNELQAAVGDAVSRTDVGDTVVCGACPPPGNDDDRDPPSEKAATSPEAEPGNGEAVSGPVPQAPQLLCFWAE